MVVDGVVHPVEHKQVIPIGLEELLVAHSFPDLLGIGGELVSSMSQNIALFVQAVDFVDPFRVHQIGRVPPPRGIEHYIVGSLVWVSLLRLS